MADGSYLVVDEATETAQGIWYKQGSLSNLLPKSKVKKIERITPPAPDAAPAPLKGTNDDDHFEVLPKSPSKQRRRAEATISRFGFI